MFGTSDLMMDIMQIIDIKKVMIRGLVSLLLSDNFFVNISASIYDTVLLLFNYFPKFFNQKTLH